MLAVVAGSDTASIAIVQTIYFFMKHPEYVERLRKDIDAAFPNLQDAVDFGKLAEMPYLNGCM